MENYYCKITNGFLRKKQFYVLHQKKLIETQLRKCLSFNFCATVQQINRWHSTSIRIVFEIWCVTSHLQHDKRTKDMETLLKLKFMNIYYNQWCVSLFINFAKWCWIFVKFNRSNDDKNASNQLVAVKLMESSKSVRTMITNRFEWKGMCCSDWHLLVLL